MEDAVNDDNSVVALSLAKVGFLCYWEDFFKLVFLSSDNVSRQRLRLKWLGTLDICTLFEGGNRIELTS